MEAKRGLIRAATTADLSAIMLIETNSFTTPWSRDFFQHELENPLNFMIVYELESAIVGYLVLWVVAGEAHIANLAVDFRYRRQGYGRALLTWAMEKARAQKAEFITLEVNAQNPAALTLYSQAGFIRTGCRLKYYENKYDALILSCKL
jgi:ribosomal-protein-alanine N-acetyltransferase